MDNFSKAVPEVALGYGFLYGPTVRAYSGGSGMATQKLSTSYTVVIHKLSTKFLFVSQVPINEKTFAINPSRTGGIWFLLKACFLSFPCLPIQYF